MVLAGLQGIFDQATPIVQGLREDPDWEESDVYGNYSLEDKDHRLTSGPLRGSRGLGLQVGFFFFFFHPGFALLVQNELTRAVVDVESLLEPA